jgi:hypothetical protein
MSEPTKLVPTCPFLGLAEDPDSHFSYPEVSHRCFAAGQAAPTSREHQSAFCLTAEYPSCPRYLEPASRDASEPASIPARPGSDRGASVQRSSLWIVLAALMGVLIVFAALYYSGLVFRTSPMSSPAAQIMPSATLSPTPSPHTTPTPGPLVEGNVPTSTAATVVDLATPSSVGTSADQLYTLVPEAGDVGWVTSGDEGGNHFGDSFLYAGVFEGQVYQAAFQFKLDPIVRGAPIHSASIELTGLRDDRLREGGAWTLRLLAPEMDTDWRQRTYQEFFNAQALEVLSPILGNQDLGEGRANVFELSPAQIAILENRIVQDKNPVVSFRIDGPLVGPDNLFGWDTGYGPQSQGNGVRLVLNVGPPPLTPPPYGYVVVTSTPTPENAITAAAIVKQITADATRIGTATPLPPNMATATPIPSYLIILPTETPGNAATAQARAALATAEAVTTGTPTPLPTDAVTATPVPSPTAIPHLVVITSTPTPGSIFAAATLSAAGTAQARSLGIPTPLPPNWVTPIVVTSTPTPANQATAQYQADLATAEAFTTGTPTPTPINVATATSTPVFVLLDGELPPMTTTPTPPVVSEVIPPELIGKIGFKSDRTGEEQIYVINPDGSGLALLSDRWPYDLAQAADAYSVDGRFRVFVKDAIINTGEDENGQVVPVQLARPALYFYDSLYKAEEQITQFGAGIAYEPAWSPTSEQVAFVSDDSGNDEIWVINRDGSGAVQLTWNTWEWDKHPSWSPDGSKIAFWSNRTGVSQVWVMDADGGNLYSLSRTGFNDWDPVWFKYSDVSDTIIRPAGAAAICNDGTYSFSAERSGTCANHQGVSKWLK